ncbi:MerR family transcriptional regulator [Saccharothrix syringae]|uniref:MerR family transcriptional regulator n=1 Tax=Saccharothrix syringae TaxID=103733 RepID=A0A5Q0GWK1_SACSY|nr:MerR family transcriptional regulator [Saccharothrix syringae]QFZ18328.1 MerR family transcriptional regulator [Saccharothrix syringae]
MLSISEFSEMCRLSPQTLRFYHSTGLLVPAGVDERTGYRSYAFEQVERAMLIGVLRGAGMGVDLVRRALDEPGAAPGLLERHREEVERLRRAQDEAIGDARALLASAPEVRVRRVPAMTVLAKPVPGDWDEGDAASAAAARELVEAARARGAVVSGPPWRSWAAERHWLVELPVEGCPGARDFAAREELSVFLPGRGTTAKYATALSRLLGHPLDGAYADVSRMRHVLHDDGVEFTAAIRRT